MRTIIVIGMIMLLPILSKLSGFDLDPVSESAGKLFSLAVVWGMFCDGFDMYLKYRMMNSKSLRRKSKL